MVDRFTFLIRASCENERSPEQLVDTSDILKITSVFVNANAVDFICVQQFENMLSNAC